MPINMGWTQFAIIVLTYLSLPTAQSYQNITASNLTHVTKDFFYEPTVLKYKNQLMYISYEKINANVRTIIKSTAIPKDVCEFTVTVPARRDFQSPEAQVLGNDKVVIAFVDALLEEDMDNIVQYVKFYIVDLNKCKYTFFKTDFDQELLRAYRPVSIIPYEKSFDVFVRSSKYCNSPDGFCLLRYTESGDPPRSLNFEKSINSTNIDQIKIYPIYEFDPAKGFVVISRATSTVLVLDENLRIVTQKKVNGTIMAEGVLNGDIGVCLKVDETEPRFECTKFDPRLKVKSKVTLGDVDYYRSKRLYNLSDGSSLLIGFITEGRFSTFVRRLNIDGRISKPETFLYECESLQTNPLDHFVELKNNIYCFSFVCHYKMITHCTTHAQIKKLLTYA